MMKNNPKYAAFIILLLAVCFAGRALAQLQVSTTPAPADTIKKNKAAVEVDMNNLKAHRAFIYAMNMHNPLLVDQYRIWMKKYPENVNIPLAIATVYYNAEMPQAREFLLRAADLQPQNGKIWFMLSNDADRWGQHDLSVEYLRKAALSDPLNADYAYYYLASFEDSEPEDYRKQVFEFVKRFPASERGAQALYWLGRDAQNINDRINYLEMLRKLYPHDKFRWSAAGMIVLADAYLQKDTKKAAALINEMNNEKDWNIRKQLAESLGQIDKLEQDRNYTDAVIKIDQVKLPKVNYFDDFIELKKFSLLEKAGEAKTAYDSVAMRFAKLPTDRLCTVLETYGEKVGKDRKQIDKDIDSIRSRSAVAAYPFHLGLYTSKDSLSLKSLKGKVVLLTFWFPGCGPCRAEFPHFQAVIDKFKSKDVAYIGINVSPEQDPFVIPLLQKTKFSFIPLQGNTEFARKYYGVDSEPENFLINQDGKIVFKDFSIDNNNHRTLELMISSLLREGKQSN